MAIGSADRDDASDPGLRSYLGRAFRQSAARALSGHALLFRRLEIHFADGAARRRSARANVIAPITIAST